ncbi:DUF3263 domain-containing protein [Rhodococcus koreensis]
MNQDDRTMLAFATKWLPYGGGDEHIFPEFGLLPGVFYQRVLALVTATLSNDVDFATRTRLRDFCSLKLSHRNPSTPEQRHVFPLGVD